MKNTILIIASLFCITGCTTTSKDGSIAGAGILYEQRGESTAKVDGDQIANILKRVGELAGTAEKALTVAGQASALIDVVKGTANDAAQVASKASEKAISAENQSVTANSVATEAKTTAATANSKASELSGELGITKAQMENAVQRLTSFESDTRSKLQTVNPDQLSELAKLRDDRSKFDERLHEVLTSQKLTEAQIKSVEEESKGMSTKEIVAMLAMAGGAAGVGGLAGKTGRSRAQPQIDNLEKNVSELQHTTLKRSEVVAKPSTVTIG